MLRKYAHLDVCAVVGDGVGVAAALDGEDAADAEAIKINVMVTRHVKVCCHGRN